MIKKTIHKLSTYILIVLLLEMVLSPAVQGLDINGVIDQDTIWTINDSPIQITGDLLVVEGTTLAIDPGVTVIFRPRPDTERGYNLTINGAMAAVGTETQPILFTAQDHDFPWGAIIFSDISRDWDAGQSSGSILSYCIVEFGGNTLLNDAMILIENAMPLITQNAIRFSANAGIAGYADDSAVSAGGNIRITDNQIYNNAAGIMLYGDGGVVSGNYFFNNNRALDITQQSNSLVIQNNTMMGSSNELFGAGLLMNLEATASGIHTYHWQQTDGPAVTLENADSAAASFDAPDPGSGVATLTFNLTVVGGSGVLATQPVEVTVIGTNEPPVASAGNDMNVLLQIGSEDTVEVSLNGTESYDPDLGIAEYQWTQESGRDVVLKGADSATSTFEVPALTFTGEEMVFRLTVTDHGGLQSEDVVKVRFFTGNIYPIADAGDDIIVIRGQLVMLDGSGSRDPDGGITAYQWIQTGGAPVELSNADTGKPYFIAPSTDGNAETLTFELSVQDTGDLQDTDEMTVQVFGPVIANPGADQTVSSGQPVTLDGSGSIDLEASAEVDFENNIIRWDNPEAGLISVTAAENANTRLYITGNDLLFTEEAGIGVYLFDWPEGSDSIDMIDNWWGTDNTTSIDEMIYDRNDDSVLPIVNYQPMAVDANEGAGSDLVYPPLADAGPDLETGMDQSVILDGSGSYDPDGIGTYQWQQIEGADVTLDNAQSPVATFIAPSGGTEGKILHFRLTMTTDGVFSHSDEVDVNVSADEALQTLEKTTGGGCFIQSTISQLDEKKGKGVKMMVASIGVLLGMLLIRQRKGIAGVSLIVMFVFFASEANAGYVAVGGGDGGDAEQYNISFEGGVEDIKASSANLLFALGMPFLAHGTDKLPENAIASPSPNDESEPLGKFRKGTEFGLYAKMGIEIGSSNLYLNAILGFTMVTESELTRSPGTGNVYEASEDTLTEPFYGAGVSFFPEKLGWNLMMHIDYDNTRGVTGLIGWFW